MKIIIQKFISLLSFFFLIMVLCSPKNPFQDIDSVSLLIDVPKKSDGFNYCIGDKVQFKVSILLPHLVKNVSIHFDENGNKDQREITTNKPKTEVISFDYVYKEKGLKKVIFTITFRDSGEKRAREYKIDIGVMPTIRNGKKLLAGSDMKLGKPLILFVDHVEFGKATYRWYKDSLLLAGEQKQSIIFNPLKESDVGQYYCIVSTNWGKDQSKEFNVTLNKNLITPVIDKQPQSLQVPAGNSARFTIGVIGEQIEYQWQKDGSNIENATKGEYKVIATSSNDGARFRCVVSNNAGKVKSNSVKLNVLYKVTYNLKDGTESYHRYYSRGYEIDLPKHTREDYIFKGWSDGSTKYDAKYIMKAKEVTFNAIWEEKSNSVIKFLKIAAGLNTSMFLKNDGSLWACGENDYGQLGYGDDLNRKLPVKIMDNIVDMSVGNFHSLILKNDGSLWACGEEGIGLPISNRKLPDHIMDGVQGMSASLAYSLILKKDGSLWTCGSNVYGQLGNGTTSFGRSPEQIMSRVQSISAGSAHSLILKNDGSLWVCGANESGQLGDGTTTNRYTPVTVMSGVQSMEAGKDHSLILKKDGSLWACGYNSNGQLGDGTTIYRSTPVQVMSDVQKISAGHTHSLILKTDGNLWVCGGNWTGQLGDGTITDRHIPKHVMSSVQSMEAGAAYSMILKKDGSLWVCGDNKFGQLGDGTNIDRLTPVQIEF